MEEKVELGLHLRRLREESGHSQKDVAAKLGYATSQFISNWERGVSTPPMKMLKRIANIYGVSGDSLFKACIAHLNDIAHKEYLEGGESGAS